MIGDDELIQKAREILHPRRISHFVEVSKASSALVTESGNVYIGVSIDSSCSLGFCAEANAIGSMVTGGESRIATIVAIGREGAILSPCERCREFIYQMDERNAETRILLKDGRVMRLKELLPEHWKQR